WSGKYAIADGQPWENQRHPSAIHGQSRRDLRPDEPSADHCEFGTTAGCVPYAPEIRKLSIIDRRCTASAQAARRTTSREQQPLVSDVSSLRVGGRLRVPIDRYHSRAKTDLCARPLRLAPDSIHCMALPQSFRQWWTVIRRIVLLRYHQN